ncbi:hypothetical protein [Microbacterium sp. Clip185]|uniref:hypothetical protein n=1 Tax=Microbacterium sp. Clip185 TaxID=3025663 RepID=UPI0023663D9A|nr:hypothetical protein [Microbacterium sp. Clip185]WDG18199.1 hypothetical protein PQV94_00330 [Microbacterium sp. Clip185]
MSDQKQSWNSTYATVGFTFFTLAVVFWLTMDNIAVALPFFVLAITFVVIGTTSKSDKTDETGDAEKE